MSATAPYTGQKPRDIYEWAGGSAVNYEPVVIPGSFAHAVDAGLLPARAPGEQQQATEDAQDAESTAAAEDDPQDTDELPCGHAPVYAESGACMICNQTFNTAEERRARTAAASDTYEGLQ